MNIGYKNKNKKKSNKKSKAGGNSGYTRSYGSAGSGYKSNYRKDGYGSSYGSNYGRSYGSGYGSNYGRGSNYGGSGWSWGTIGGLGAIEEDKDELFIANHDSYFTPKTYEIESRIPWGRNLRSKDNIDLIKEMSRFFFYKMMDNKSYIDEHYLDETTMNEEQLGERDNKTPFYESLWDKYVPGYTPLEKAMSIFNELATKNKDREDRGEKTGDKMTEDMRSDIEEIEFDHDTFVDPEYNELLDMDFFKEKGMNKVNILNRISLIQNLGSQFKIEKEVTEKVVQNSKLISKKMMRDYSQIFNVDLYQRLFPDFKTKLATKNLTVNVPIDKTEHKQKIIMILDFSGSMSNNLKQEWVLAILIDRLKYCIKEEAEVFFSYFCGNPREMSFTHIKDRKSAIEFWQTFSTMPNGGGTDVGAMVEKIHSEIELGRLMNLDVDLRDEKPEILVINDGQDHIGRNSFVYKTNAICLYQDNEELKQLCIKNDGKYVSVIGGRHSRDGYGTDQTANVTMYSKESIEKLTL
jgi:hypothetical protein